MAVARLDCYSCAAPRHIRLDMLKLAYDPCMLISGMAARCSVGVHVKSVDFATRLNFKDLLSKMMPLGLGTHSRQRRRST